MELSCKVEYALIALLELANHPNPDEPLQIKQIAAKQSIPDRYLEQVFSALRHAGIVRSQRGNKGGYKLAREPWQISLLEVFSCLEVAESLKRQQDATSLDRSIVRDIWKEAQQSAKDILERRTIRDLCQERQQRQQVNSMYYI